MFAVASFTIFTKVTCQKSKFSMETTKNKDIKRKKEVANKTQKKEHLQQQTIIELMTFTFTQHCLKNIQGVLHITLQY